MKIFFLILAMLLIIWHILVITDDVIKMKQGKFEYTTKGFIYCHVLPLFGWGYVVWYFFGW